LVTASTFYNRRAEQLAALAARHALPAMYPFREHALAGGLMSYGSSLGDTMRQAGIYAGRILKGEKPSDLPVMRSSKVELVFARNLAILYGIVKQCGNDQVFVLAGSRAQRFRALCFVERRVKRQRETRWRAG
jgi:ABC-type uncharacterized transport system substrate-binding protein